MKVKLGYIIWGQKLATRKKYAGISSYPVDFLMSRPLISETISLTCGGVKYMDLVTGFLR